MPARSWSNARRPAARRTACPGAIVLKRLMLLEVSLVAIPANAYAGIRSVKYRPDQVPADVVKRLASDQEQLAIAIEIARFHGVRV